MIIFYRLCLIHVLGTQWYLVVRSMDMHPASYLHGHLWSESGAWEKGDMAHFHRTTSLTNWGSRLWSKACSAPAQQVNTNYDQSTHEDRLQQDWRPKQNVLCFIILFFKWTPGCVRKLIQPIQRVAEMNITIWKYDPSTLLWIMLDE